MATTGKTNQTVLCPVCGGTKQMLYPIHGTDKATGINTIAEGRSVCFLCMGHGQIHQLKNQLFERGEIALPRNGYYMPKEGGEICKS